MWKWITAIAGAVIVVFSALSWYVSYANRTHPAVWPAFGGGSDRRNVSPVLFPRNPERLWSVPLEGGQGSGLIVGEDGTLYVTAGNQLLAFGPDGKQKWAFPRDSLLVATALGRHGTLYLQFLDGIYALSTDGRLQWKYPFEEETAPSGFVGGLMVGQGGVIYAVNPPYLISLREDGSLRWRLRSDGYTSLPAESLDGRILITGRDVLYAVDRDGDVAWRWDLPPSHVSFRYLAVGPDGKIYVRSAERLVILTKDGEFYEEKQVGKGSPNVVAVGEGFVQDGPYRWEDSGSERWVDLPWTTGQVVPMIDKKGYTLLVRWPRPGQYREVPNGDLVLVDAEGRQVWRLEAEGPTIWAAPAGDRRICMVSRGEEQTMLSCYGDP